MEKIGLGIESSSSLKTQFTPLCFRCDGKQVHPVVDRTIKLWNWKVAGDKTRQAEENHTAKSPIFGHKRLCVVCCSTLNNEFILSESKDR